MKIPLPHPKILLVDDDSQALDSTRRILELEEYQVLIARDGQEALDLVRSMNDIDLVVTDVRMPRMGGIDFFRALEVCKKSIPVILMTAYGQVEDAVWAMKMGAVDFLTKPFKRQTLLSAVESGLKRSRAQVRPIVSNPGEKLSAIDSLVGDSLAMKRLRVMIQQVAVTEAEVLISGESGTGKELVARAIHECSSRAQQPFVAINCAAIPENLIESELFGYERGAFTGAVASKPGLFEAAHGGTLLLDEIGDLPIQLQSKLLRTLQEGEVRRLGATRSTVVDVRVLSATHRQLRDRVTQGSFREDLLYRLEVIGLVVPSLRERLEDLDSLVQSFLSKASIRHGKPGLGISTEAMDALRLHQWPGNVRELENVIERGVVFAEGTQIEASHLPEHLVKRKMGMVSSEITVPIGTPLRDLEELMIRKTLDATEGDKEMTAKLLGINSRTIYRKLEKKSERSE